MDYFCSTRYIIVMIKGIYTLTLAIVALVAFVSCGEDRTHEYLELTAENQWTYTQMKENYLWGNEIKSPDKKEFFATPSKFFKSILSKNDNTSFLTDSASSTSYGMKFTIMRDPIGEKRNQYYALVLFVEPGSPAAVAGIERGTWIASIGGKAMTSSMSSSMQSGVATEITTRTIEYNDDEELYFWSEPDTITIPQASAVTEEAVYLHSTYSLRNGKVGYIVCNSLDGENVTSQFSDILLGFAAEDITDIILDMRYCSGGTIENAADVASMFVPASLSGTPFAKSVDKDSVETLFCYNEQVANMSDKKLYIVTGNDTKGIAELFITSVNASRGMHEVVTVGAETNGSNLLTRKIESPYGFTICPAVAYLYASDGELLQADGIEADYPLNELEEPEHIFHLGSKQEYILRNIEYLIINGSLPAE